MLEVVRAKEEVELCREEGGMYGREREREGRSREGGRGGEIIDYKFTEG